MEHRIIDPPRSQFERLPTPLTSGERQLIDLFEGTESGKCTFNQRVTPDLVLLNPSVGIAEIKDWDLNAMEYFAKSTSINGPG